jgi:hypothetical protein
VDRDGAWRGFHGGLNKSAVLLARSSLEAATNQLKVTGKDLRAKISNLAASGKITEDLATWAHEIRIRAPQSGTRLE